MDKTKILSVIILVVGIFIAIYISCHLQYAEPYFAPSVINGINILNQGHLDYNIMTLAHRRLASDLNIENSYPLPSILTAILLAVTGLPYEKLAFIPIAGIAALLYFVLAQYVLDNKHNGLAALFASIYFIFNLSNQLSSLTTGRSPIGTIALMLFIISFLRLLESPKDKTLSWLFICIIATIMAGVTYYTATMAIIIILIFSIIFTQNKFNVGAFGETLFPRGFSLLIIAVYLFFVPAILVSVAPHLNLHLFLNNITNAIFAKLGQENTESSNIYGALLQPHLINYFRLWGLRIVLILSIISIAYIVFIGILNPGKRNTRYWLYTIITIGVSSSELLYMFKLSALRIRFILSFGFLCVLCVLSQLKDKPRKILAFAITALTVTIVICNLSFAIQQGGDAAAKPYAVDKTKPVADYISRIPTGTIGADAGYSSVLWLHLANGNRNSNISVMPLWSDALLLKDAQESSATPLIDALNRQKINYLLLNTDDMLFFGDVWGYSIKVNRGPWMQNMPIDSIYDDGQFVLYKNGGRK